MTLFRELHGKTVVTFMDGWSAAGEPVVFILFKDGTSVEIERSYKPVRIEDPKIPSLTQE